MTMLDTGWGCAALLLTGVLLFAANHQARAAWPDGEAPAWILNVAAPSSSSSSGGSQSAGATVSATASANATSTGSTSGQGSCSAESSSQAEVRVGNKVVQRSAHKRAVQTGNGCSASSESSAEVNTGPSTTSEPPGAPQQ